MGTRADFYVGRGEQAEWIGSIAWDGYPSGIANQVLQSTGDESFRHAVASFLKREDGTLPEQGWPWPWDDSQTTDYAYAFDGGKVWASCFGHAWFDPVADIDRSLDEEDADMKGGKVAVFPNMKDRANNPPMGDKRSGCLVVGFV